MERLVELIGNGAVPLAELAERAEVSEMDIRRAVQMDGRFAVIGESLAYSPALHDGTVWTVPIDPDDASGESSDGTRSDGTPHEIPGGFVRAEPHLITLAWWLVTNPVPRLDADGNEIDRLRDVGIWVDDHDADVIYGSADWLEGVGPIAAFHVTTDGIRVEPLDQAPAPDPDQVAAVRAAYDEVATEHDASGFGDVSQRPQFTVVVSVLLEALARNGDAFRKAPIAPVPELLAAAGLELNDGLVAETGFDWDGLGAWQNRNRLSAAYGLSDDQLDGLMMMVGACELVAEIGDAAFGGTDDERAGARILFAGLLADSSITGAFLQETQERGLNFHAIQTFTESILAGVGGTGVDVSGVVWLRSLCHAIAGEWDDAIRIVETHVDESTTHSLLLVEAAFNAADRSEAAKAQQLLTRAGVTRADDESMLPEEALRLLDEIQPFTGRRARTDVKRNDPCPCGSGRKYKQCHLGKEALALDERAPWLYEKACRFVRGEAPDMLEFVAAGLSEHADDLYESLIDLPFTMDLVLDEYEEWNQFLEQRGQLLPDDERELAAVWRDVPRAVYAVESTRGSRVGGELRLRNVATDEIVVVAGVQLDERIEPDQYFVGRPLPVGDTYRSMSGFFPLDASRADEAMAAIAAGENEALLGVLAAELTLD
ncbi:SEC-C motif-containing protein [Ilumatobacter fluminis]|uniref:SEC-C motif-containing protein n=1 Tax=Ilumatobacter fluminis TaxID=467091 RepID=A0A4R7I633_9ACTN|nr:SEC-C motif-containing protein [Ilumatobacter fluminis]